MTAYDALAASNITLPDWISFKQTVLEQGLKAKAASKLSRTKNWKTLLRSDLVPEGDLVDAIQHNGLTISPPCKPRPPRQRWPSAIPEDLLPLPPPLPSSLARPMARRPPLLAPLANL